MNDQETGTAANGGRARPRNIGMKVVIACVAAILLAYLASPYISFWRFTKVIRSSDGRRMESYVDFRAVRQSLKEQLRGNVARTSGAPADRKQDPFSGLLERLAPALIDQLVDAFITPDGLAALIADPQIARAAEAKDPAALTRAGSADRQINRSDVRYAFFTGPRDFLVDVQGTKLQFRFSKFHWVLKEVKLPLESTKP